MANIGWGEQITKIILKYVIHCIKVCYSLYNNIDYCHMFPLLKFSKQDTSQMSILNPLQSTYKTKLMAGPTLYRRNEFPSHRRQRNDFTSSDLCGYGEDQYPSIQSCLIPITPIPIWDNSSSPNSLKVSWWTL